MPHYGLVCITTTDDVRFRTITRTRLRTLAPQAQIETLRELYRDNLRRLENAFDFCARRGIHLYRLTSGLFPQSEEPPGSDIVAELDLAKAGARATDLGIRLVMHPDQFVVLSSDDDRIVANSVAILRRHARELELLGQPRSAWAAITIHGGKGGRAEQLIESLNALPEGVKQRIALENDEHAYGAEEILAICRRANVPMIFDAHHHLVHEHLDSYDHPSIDAFTKAAAETWPDPSWQIVHISNGRDSLRDPKHADYIAAMPRAFDEVPWIEVEAKQKERAIARLRRKKTAGRTRRPSSSQERCLLTSAVISNIET